DLRSPFPTLSSFPFPFSLRMSESTGHAADVKTFTESHLDVMLKVRFSRSREGLCRRAGADEIAVAVGLSYATHRRPVLRVDEAAQRVDGDLARVRMRPVADGDRLRGVRCVHERVVVGGPLPRRHRER